LTGAERDILARVPMTGAALLENIPRLGNVAEIVRYQQKNFDGSGLPNDSVSGEAIPIGARILKVLNELLEMEASKKSRPEAFRNMKRTEGVFDPKVLEALAACFDVYIEEKDGEQSRTASVRVNDLIVGNILADDVKTVEGSLIVTAGSQVTQPLLQKLRNFSELRGLQEPITIKVS
jgi:HD-GYP domain-containing protein (c-di-GMP phosphodiesterase class II)